MKLFKDKRANMDMLSGIAVGLLALVIIFSIVMTIGPKLEDVAAIDKPAYATGTLTFTGNVSDTETVTIGGIVYEFDTEGNTTAGNVPVNVSDVLPAIATVNLTAAINGNATSSAILTASSTATTVVLTYDTKTTTAGNFVATTDTVTNADFGAATLTGGVADTGWSSSDIPAPASVWSDNATFISLAAMVIIISILMAYVFRMRGAGGGGGI